MEVEKRVKGGFFQLFDWNAKSRKKLFSSKSELHDNSNQVKENIHGSALARVHKVLENGFDLNLRDQNHYHYASSLSGDSQYGTKPPGVVARLMGLDSLPTKNATEPCFSPFIEPHSFRDSNYLRFATALQSEHDIVIFESMRNKLDGLTRNPVEVRLQQKVHNDRPIERFQREVLPPKSAKPISVTQHRLLSPVKSPGFIPPKNAAYIIEDAAKIIERSPRKGKLPSLGSSYVPLRVQDLKEKMEFAQKSSRSDDASRKGKEHNSIKNLKKQTVAKNQVQSADSYLQKGIEESKRVRSQRLKSMEKSRSVAAQEKPRIVKREGLVPVDSRSSVKQKEHTQRKVEKQSSAKRTSEVLRLNNQKQNSASVKDGENSKPLSSQPKDMKKSYLSTNDINGRGNRTVDKIVVTNVVTSRKTNIVPYDHGKELSSSREKTVSKKKLHINNGNILSDGSIAPKQLVMKDEKSVRCNAAVEGDCEWDTIDKKNNLDVVSFTFTSPIKKSGDGHNSWGKFSEINRSLFPTCDPFVCESDLRSAINGDSLSALLEIKLKELNSMVELSPQNMSEAASLSNSANSYGNSNGKEEILNASDCHSINKPKLKAVKEKKALEHMEDWDNSKAENHRYSHLQELSSVSNQPSFSEASWDSFDVDRSSRNEGSVQCLSLESYEVTSRSSARKSHTADEGDVEVSDTATSASTHQTATSNLYTPLQYIRDILSSAELMFEEFVLEQSQNVISSDFFHLLENQKMQQNEYFKKLQDKVLFDCVEECLEFRCHRILAGSNAWVKMTTLFHNRKWLAEEVYRDISGWTNDGELMVDELVEKDMNSKSGKWIDFEIEAFEEGAEVEDGILASLVDELVDDFFLF